MLKIVSKENGDTVALVIPERVDLTDSISFTYENIKLIKSMYDYDDILQLLAEFNQH